MGAFNFSEKRGVGSFEYDSDLNFINVKDINEKIVNKATLKANAFLEKSGLYNIPEFKESYCNMRNYFYNKEIIKIEEGYYEGFKFYVDYKEIQDLCENFLYERECDLMKINRNGMRVCVENGESKYEVAKEIADKLYDCICTYATSLLYIFGMKNSFNEVYQTGFFSCFSTPITKALIKTARAI